MTDCDEMTRSVDAIYKNILDKFNPNSRQLISAGKAYLKALHGTSTAAKLYIDAIVRLAHNAQQGTWGGTTDIGTTLMQIVEVYQEIQAQQINLLKAFYVDLLVPLEANIEKDTKVVQGEQKKFMQQHKIRQEAYLKAAGTVKKQRKKSKSSKTSTNIDKELKQMQILEEEKNKLEGFCEHSLRNAITQERRRYGFVLERQCSLAKHFLVYHTKGQALIEQNLSQWEEIAKTREFLPEVMNSMFPSQREDGLFSAIDDDRLSTVSLRKTKSMESSCADLRSLHNDHPVPLHLTRAKSDFNLASSHQSLADTNPRPRSMAVEELPRRERVRALYSYLSSGDHQMSFHEGDLIALIGERNQGWQYGENLRSRRFGWFPIAYTEPLAFEEQDEFCHSSPVGHYHRFHSLDFTTEARNMMISNYKNSNSFSSTLRPHSMCVDGSLSRTSTISKASEKSGSSSGQDEGRGRSPPPPPPPLPSVSSSPTTPTPEMNPRYECRNYISPMPPLVATLQPHKNINGINHHSSNDSGFGNDSNPPPPPEIDYSDDEPPRDNVFASVKLRKTVVNDRSAPILS